MLWKNQQFLVVLVAIMAVQWIAPQQDDTPVTTISINGIPGIQFDLVRFVVKPDEKIKLVFSNKDDMGHNLLITSPGSRQEVVEEAQRLNEKGPIMDYIPKSPKVLWAIPVIYAGETKSITFTAPKEPGAYPYVCTYPGHGTIMYGVMYVSLNGKIPEISQDTNIPEHRRQESGLEAKQHSDHSLHSQENPVPLHPYQLIPPYHYRVFMEESGLTSIAVHLPQQLSYSWDAGSCRLKLAWEGDFLDNSDLWHGHKNAYAKVLGNIFYRDKTEYPLRIGNLATIPDTEFKSYRLVNRYPEFQYLVSNVKVYELIKPNAEGSGLERNFKMPDVEKTVWFVSDPEDGIDYHSSVGIWEKGILTLSPEQAKEFTITMKKRGGIK